MTVTTLRFDIPGAPVPKERPRVVNGHTFTPARTAKYEKQVAACARAAGAVPKECPVVLRMRFFLPDARRRDWDNLAKAVSDGMNGVAYADDSQIGCAVVEKHIDRENPRASVELTYIEGEEES